LARKSLGKRGDNSGINLSRRTFGSFRTGYSGTVETNDKIPFSLQDKEERRFSKLLYSQKRTPKKGQGRNVTALMSLNQKGPVKGNRLRSSM